MKWALILLLAVGGYFAWKHFKAEPPPEPAEVADPTRTTGADVQNRVDTRSGTVDPWAK